MLRAIATAFTFLTRLPGVARWADPEPGALSRASAYFPLVGAVVGGWCALGHWLGLVWFEAPWLAAAAAVLFGVVLTGGFHEDGLADTADGLGGGFDRARQLEIMRDSRVGSYGVLALLLALAWKLGALAALSTAEAFAALVLAHVWARWSALPLIWALPYLRESSNHKPLADAAGAREASIASILAIALSLAVAPPLPVFGALGVAALVTALGGLYVQRQIGGYTGDVLGAVNQAVEVAILLYWVALTASA